MNKEFLALQKKAGLSNKQVAKLLGVGVRTIERYKSGDRAVHQMIINTLNLFMQNKELKMESTILINQKRSGNGEISDIQSEHFEREVSFSQNENFAFVKAAIYNDDDHKMFASIADAIYFACDSDFAGMIVGRDGSEYSKHGTYAHNTFKRKSRY